MRSTPRAATAAVLTLLLAGCAGGAAEPQTNPSTTASTTTGTRISTPTASVTSPEDRATAKAEAAVRAYYRAQTDCLTEPQTSKPTCFDDVAIGTELLNMRNGLSSAKSMGTHVQGSIDVVSVGVSKLMLKENLKANPPLVPTVTLEVCRDVSNFNVVDKSGGSIVPADRMARAVDIINVYNYQYPDEAQWRVGYVVQAKDPKC